MVKVIKLQDYESMYSWRINHDGIESKINSGLKELRTKVGLTTVDWANRGLDYHKMLLFCYVELSYSNRKGKYLYDLGTEVLGNPTEGYYKSLENLAKRIK